MAITALRLLRGCRRTARRSIAGDGWCRSVSARWWCDPPSCPISGERAGDWKSARGPASSIGVFPDQPVSSTVSITVLLVTPARAKKLSAFASVEIDIDGVQIGVHGIRAMREDGGTAIELPKFRDAGGVWRAAITLPEEVHSPIAKAVFDELVERGLAVRRLGAMTAVSPARVDEKVA